MCTYVYIYVYMYVCIYIYIYVYIYVYIAASPKLATRICRSRSPLVTSGDPRIYLMCARKQASKQASKHAAGGKSIAGDTSTLTAAGRPPTLTVTPLFTYNYMCIYGSISLSS